MAGSKEVQRAHPTDERQDGEGWTVVKRGRRGQQSRQATQTINSGVGERSGPSERPQPAQPEQRWIEVQPAVTEVPPEIRQARTTPHLSKRQRRRMRRQELAQARGGPTAGKRTAPPRPPARPTQQTPPYSTGRATEGNFKTSAAPQPSQPVVWREGPSEQQTREVATGRTDGGNFKAPAVPQPSAWEKGPPEDGAK